MPARRHRGAAVEPAGARKLTRPWGETTARSVSDNVMEKLYTGTEENDAAIAQRLATVAADKA